MSCCFLIYTKSYNKNRKQNRRPEEKSCPLPTKPPLTVQVCFTHILMKNWQLFYTDMVTYKPGIHIAYTEADIVWFLMVHMSQNHVIYRICTRINCFSSWLSKCFHATCLVTTIFLYHNKHHNIIFLNGKEWDIHLKIFLFHIINKS